MNLDKSVMLNMVKWYKVTGECGSFLFLLVYLQFSQIWSSDKNIRWILTDHVSVVVCMKPNMFVTFSVVVVLFVTTV